MTTMVTNNKEPSIATLTKIQRRKLQEFSKPSEVAASAGVLNMMATTVLAVRFPAYYWIWHLVRTFFYLPRRYFRYMKNGQELYLLDWCYFVTYMTTIGTVAAFLRITLGFETALVEYNTLLLHAGFAMSCGPLVWSVFVFRNSLVFHDVDRSTSVFIHLSPFILMWCLRWRAGTPSSIQQAFPDMFRTCSSNEEFAAADECLHSVSPLNSSRNIFWCQPCGAPPSAFLVPPALLYVCVWAVPHFYLLFVRWGDWIAQTKRETLYQYFVETNPELNARFETYLSSTVVAKKYAGPLGYMLLHLVISVVLAATSYVLWHSFFLHTLVFFLALAKAIHNGSQFMFRIFAYRFAEEQLRQHRSVLD